VDGFRKFLRSIPNRFLWLLVLTPILAVSGWSAYFIGRYLGMPAPIAASVSACLDGTALLAADYSVKYAQAGMGDGGPKFVVWLFAGTAAFIQTRHALIGNELPGSWVLWAALPVAAATVFELHLKWTKRKAKARSGVAYPKPLPSFGLITWVYYPISTHFRLRDVVGERREVMLEAAKTIDFVPKRSMVSVGVSPEFETSTDDTSETTETPEFQTQEQTTPRVSRARQAPELPDGVTVLDVRRWAKQHGYKKARGPLPGSVVEAYVSAHSG
jgi:hypothetical protein